MENREIIIWTAIVLGLTPFIAYGLSTSISAYDSFIVSSGSMEPEIRTGSVIYTVETEASQIKINDTITFRTGNGFTTHKVIDLRSDEEVSFKTKGVANEEPDPGWVSEEQVVGKVVFTVPFIGYILDWAGTFYGMIFLVVIPAGIILAYELKTILTEIDYFDGAESLRGFMPSLVPSLVLLLLTGILAWQILFQGEMSFNPTTIALIIIGILFLGIIMLELRDKV
jgi:signal peptidase I